MLPFSNKSSFGKSTSTTSFSKFGPATNQQNSYSLGKTNSFGALTAQTNGGDSSLTQQNNIFQTHSKSPFGTFTTPRQQETPVGTVVQRKPVTGFEMPSKAGMPSLKVNYVCITLMDEYATKSLDELRFEDYNRSPQGGQTKTNFVFPENKTTFGPVGPSNATQEQFPCIQQTLPTFNFNSSNPNQHFPSSIHPPPSTQIHSEPIFRQPQVAASNTAQQTNQFPFKLAQPQAYPQFKTTESGPMFDKSVSKPTNNYFVTPTKTRAESFFSPKPLETFQLNQQPHIFTAANTVVSQPSQAVFTTNPSQLFFTPPIVGGVESETHPASLFEQGNVLKGEIDLHSVASQLYESFPHRKIFQGISVEKYKTKHNDEAAINKQVPSPASVAFPEKASRAANRERYKFKLLENTVNESTFSKSFVNQSSGKRLVLKNKSNGDVQESLNDNFKDGILNQLKIRDMSETKLKIRGETINNDSTVTSNNADGESLGADSVQIEVSCQIHEELPTRNSLGKNQVWEDKSTMMDDSPKPNHPKRLARPGYYTVPPLEELRKTPLLEGFTIGRQGYGKIYFPEVGDVSDIDFDEIVHFEYRQVEVYPNENNKPVVGEGLNRPAVITLENVWPRHRITHEPIKDARVIHKSDFLDRLNSLSSDQNARLLDYRADTGSWIFAVEHFTKFRYIDYEEYHPRATNGNEIAETANKMAGNINEMHGNSHKPAQTKNKMVKTKHGTDELIHASKNTCASAKNTPLMKLLFFNVHWDETENRSTDIKKMGKNKGRSDIQCHVILNSGHFVPPQKTLLNSKNIKDFGVFKGKAFKVGWGPYFTFTASPYGSSATVQLLQIQNRTFSGTDIEHLKITRGEIRIRCDHSSLPLFETNVGYDLLLRQYELSERYHGNHNLLYGEVWKLCLSLWGPNATTPTNRREMFSQWLEDITAPYLTDNLELYIFSAETTIKNIFIYLTGHKISRASELAMMGGFVRLSLLISQADANPDVKLLIRGQLEQWNNEGALKNINKDMIKIYMLLGGVPLLSDINVCEGLEWKQAMAVYFWYISPIGVSLISGVNEYKNAFCNLKHAREPFVDETEDLSVYHLLFQIILLFTNKFNLNQVLNPLTHTNSDLNDYQLSWLLLQVFTSLKNGPISENVSRMLSIQFSSQLESIGQWKWSIFVLLFIRDTSIKTKEIAEVLRRNSKSGDDDSLVNDFKIEPKFIHATKTNDNREGLKQKIVSYKHLVLAEDWCGANGIAMDFLIPEMVAMGEWSKLKLLLQDVIPGREKLFKWESRVGLVLDIMSVYERVTIGIKDITEFDLRRMKGDITGFCNRISEFPVNKKSIKHVSAVTEFSRFVATLIKILYCQLQPITSASLKEAIGLVRLLIVPPDYKHDQFIGYIHEYLKIK